MRPLAAGLLLCCLLPNLARGAELVITRVDDGLYRSRAPLGRAELEQVRRAGVRTVLDLRAYRPLASRREARLAAEQGLAYRGFRYAAPARLLGDTEGAYRQLLRRQDYPLLVHCQLNRDRTSLLIGLYRVRVQGWPPQAAYDEMMRFGLLERLTDFHRYFWENTYGPGMPATPAGPRPAALGR